MNPEKINGIDTIQELKGTMPKTIEVPFNFQYTQHTLQQGRNTCFIAIIPYCFKCKVPLVWHTHPQDVLYHCPECKTKWIKGKGWKDDEARMMRNICKDSKNE